MFSGEGPYLLTRLFEPTLIASAPSRIVNLSSVMHRYGVITSAKDFLFQRKRRIGGDYSAAKLGNALFTLEHQRRLGHLGVQVNAPQDDDTSLQSSVVR